jgi:hypothetical protein
MHNVLETSARPRLLGIAVILMVPTRSGRVHRFTEYFQHGPSDEASKAGWEERQVSEEGESAHSRTDVAANGGWTFPLANVAYPGRTIYIKVNCAVADRVQTLLLSIGLLAGVLYGWYVRAPEGVTVAPASNVEYIG